MPYYTPDPEEEIEEVIESIRGYIVHGTDKPEDAKLLAQQILEGIVAGIEAMNWQDEIKANQAEHARLAESVRTFNKPK